MYLHRRGEDGAREVLLLRRVSRGGRFWQGVTGAPEWGEPDEQAAVREVREETGFDVEIVPLDFRYELHRKEDDAELWDRLYEPWDEDHSRGVLHSGGPVRLGTDD